MNSHLPLTPEEDRYGSLARTIPVGWLAIDLSGFGEKKIKYYKLFFFKEKKDLGDLAGQKLRDISVIRLSKKARNEQ